MQKKKRKKKPTKLKKDLKKKKSCKFLTTTRLRLSPLLLPLLLLLQHKNNKISMCTDWMAARLNFLKLFIHEETGFLQQIFFPCSSANKNKTHYVSRFKWDIFSIKFLLHFHPLIPYSPPPYPNLKHLQKLKPFIYIFQNHLDAVFALKLKILNYTYYRGITIVICSNLFLWKK